jgi:general secretion pathway protein F
MPVFEYKGFDSGGGAVSGLIDADNSKVARGRLRRQGVFPTEVKEQSGEATTGTGLNMEIDFQQYLEFVSTRDVANLTNQMSVLIGASVPMAETLAALVEQTEKNKLKVILSKVRERVNEGATLADALADHPKIFDDLYISMVRAGERTGALATVLQRLSKFADEAVKLQGQIVSALAYPVLMAVVGVFLIVAIFVGVLPQVRQMFSAFGGEENLPVITQVVFWFGDTLIGYGWIFPVFLFGFITLFRRWTSTPSGRDRFDRFKLTMPLFGRLNRLVATSRFCRTLGTLLVSGVPIVSALGIVKDVVGNVVIADVIQQASINIQEGQSIARPLQESGQFPPMVIHMIKVGERTGELERMLNLIADAYEGEVENTVKAVTSLLGPLTILVMGGVVFVVALGLLLPMQELSSSIR